MYKIKLPIKLDGERYGIRFLDGEGETDNKTLAEKLRAKGFEVEEKNQRKHTPKKNTASKDPIDESTEAGESNAE